MWQAASEGSVGEPCNLSSQRLTGGKAGGPDVLVTVTRPPCHCNCKTLFTLSGRTFTTSVGLQRINSFQGTWYPQYMKVDDVLRGTEVTARPIPLYAGRCYGQRHAEPRDLRFSPSSLHLY